MHDPKKDLSEFAIDTLADLDEDDPEFGETVVPEDNMLGDYPAPGDTLHMPK